MNRLDVGSVDALLYRGAPAAPAASRRRQVEIVMKLLLLPRKHKDLAAVDAAQLDIAVHDPNLWLLAACSGCRSANSNLLTTAADDDRNVCDHCRRPTTTSPGTRTRGNF
jgi:hypothetical protein